jgi:hypothetical protein
MSFPLSRRQMLAQAGHGLGAIALSQILRSPAEAALAGLPHHVAKAKRVIFLFMSGGMTQFESFDHKPQLKERQGQDLPASFLKGKELVGMSKNQAHIPLVGSRFKFAQHGKSGAWISEIFPHTAKVADELCFIKSMRSDAVNHDPALTMMQTGAPLPSRPTMGAWINYCLGRENQDLPGFIVLITKKPADQPLTSRLWDNGFLPSQYQGVQFRAGSEPVLYLNNPPGVSSSSTRRMLDTLKQLHHLDLQQQRATAEIEAKIEQAEMAFRMQTSVPEAVDVSKEPQHVLDLYGPDAKEPGTFARNCLLARRMAERGVRFIQLYHPGWDLHGGVPETMPHLAKEVDQGAAALIADLKQRDMLKDTLVIFGSEFGRTCYSQGAISKKTGSYGREHHRDCFTFWMAGGGVKPGITHGESDDFGYQAALDPVHVNDFHATVLHLLGIDHEQLTVRHQGRDYRLTDVGGRIVKPILA